MIPLTDALAFLHEQRLTHRDIKPQNIIFVNGRPKLADVGLVTDIRSDNQVRSRPGTLGYMPPAPERVGTVAADIYGMGMVLFVISTGRQPDDFPIPPTTLPESREFRLLNPVVLRACAGRPQERYPSAADLGAALREVQNSLG
jgi:eukaryotic-like serine/threonine-protein kinase